MLARLRLWAHQLKAQLMTLWFCRSHPDSPMLAKISAVLVVAYAFSPIDLIPDFIPVLGYLDDVIIVPIGIYVTLRLMPHRVLEECRTKADAWIAARKDKPESYLTAILIVAIWIGLAYWAWRFASVWLASAA